MRSAVAGFIGLCLLLLASPAGAQERVMVVGFDANGDPLLNAHVQPTNRGSVTEWRSCPPDGSPCVPLPQSAYDAGAAAVNLDHAPGRRPAAVGNMPAGTTFEAAFVVDGTPSTLRTQPWTGRMAVSFPGFAGAPTVGAPVTLTPAATTGGWNPAPPKSYYDGGGAVYVCPQPTGGDCYWINTRQLRAHYAGWYVFTTYSRAWVDPGLPIAMASLPAPGDYPVPLNLAPGGTTAGLTSTSPALGPICCVPHVIIDPSSPRTSPTATIAARAVRRSGRTVVGTVTCAVRCRVKLTVRGGGKPAVQRSFSGVGKQTLSVSGRRGRLRVNVLVDGTPVASGTTEAR